MDEEERCNTSLGLGLGLGIGIGNGVGIKTEKELKQNKKVFWLDLALPLHPKTEASDHDHKYDEEKDDQDSFISSKTSDDQEEDRRIHKRVRDVDVYSNIIGGSRKKLKLSIEQTTVLENSFKIHSTLNTGQKQELAKKLNLLPRQIEVWFQNRRARTKLKHIEQECELLKKHCETLSDENRRLKKELQDLRRCSLKFDHHQSPQPLYIQCPTMTAIHHACGKTGISGYQDTKTVAVSNVVHMHDDSDSDKMNTSKLL